MAAFAAGVGLVSGGAKVVNEPTWLKVLPDSLVAEIRNEQFFEAVKPVRATAAAVVVPPLTVPGLTEAVSTPVVKVESREYSKPSVV